MNFVRQHSEPNIQPYVKKASTVMNFGDAVFISSGVIDKAGATTAAKDIIGVVQETIAATDADYATARDIAVDVAEKGDNADWFLALVGTGTPVLATHVGNSYDLTSAGAVDLTGTTYKVVKVQRIIDSTHVMVSFTGAPGTNVS
jgi:hypothetical protein